MKLLLSKIGFGLFLIWNVFVHLLKNTILGKALVVLILLTGGLYWYVTTNKPTFRNHYDKSKSVVIPSGASFRQVADSLSKQGLLNQKDLFLILGKITGKEKKVQAGYFEIPSGMSAWELVHYLENAPTKKVKVTIPEGILSDRIAAIISEALEIDSSRFVRLVNDSSFATALTGEPTSSLEGYLMPETYVFEWKTPPEQIISFLVNRTLDLFKPDSVMKRLAEMKMTRHDIITLASIVEGEAVIDSERVVISSLYHNRLRIKMRLQADPTIQFAIPGPPRRLLFKDLEFDSPYNTYRYAGLPPGPINNPGEASVRATIFPAKTPYIYMVAYGDGSHKFSRTLKEHNYWHQRFNEVRRQERRKQRNR